MERKSSLQITRNTENKKLDNTLIKENCLIQQNLSSLLRHIKEKFYWVHCKQTLWWIWTPHKTSIKILTKINWTGLRMSYHLFSFIFIVILKCARQRQYLNMMKYKKISGCMRAESWMKNMNGISIIAYQFCVPFSNTLTMCYTLFGKK